MSAITDDRRGWVQVDQPEMLCALRKLARFRRPRASKSPAETRKFILMWNGEDLILSNGITGLHVKAEGTWPTDAVLPYALLEIVTTLVAGQPKAETLVIEALENHLRIGGATFTCRFQNAEINVRKAVNDEQEVQRVKEPHPFESHFGNGALRDPARVMCHIKAIYPSCYWIFPPDQHVLAFPDIPKLLVRVTDRYIDLRMLANPDPDSEKWFAQSTLWKRLGHADIEKHGLENILNQAAHIADLGREN